MNVPHLRKADYFFATLPAAASETAHTVSRLTLSDWEIITRIGTTLAGFLIGSAFLIWKWRREAKRRTNPPFHLD